MVRDKEGRRKSKIWYDRWRRCKYTSYETLFGIVTCHATTMVQLVDVLIAFRLRYV